MILGGAHHYRPKSKNELPYVELVNHRTATELMAEYSLDCQSEQLKTASGLHRAITTMNRIELFCYWAVGKYGSHSPCSRWRMQQDKNGYGSRDVEWGLGLPVKQKGLAT